MKGPILKRTTLLQKTLRQLQARTRMAIGRAALKAPWIFDDIKRLARGEAIPERQAQERVALVKRLAKLACGHRPEKVAVSEMRKFCGWLLPGLTGAGEVLGQLNDVTTLDGFNRLMDLWLNGLVRTGDSHIHPELLPAETLDAV